MKFTFSARSALLASAAALALTACTQANSPESSGNSGAITISPIPSGSGGTGGAGAAFATRSTAPTSQANCATGLVFVSNVNVPNVGGTGGTPTNFCSLTSAGGGTVTSTVNIPLQADPILISGTVFLGNASGTAATVTFAPGQRFITQGASGIVDLLVVSRGSRAIIKGTSTNPIIFTSMQDYADNGLPDGSSSSSEWGGLAINGRAPLNECTVDNTATTGTDACRQNGEGGSGVFGGGSATDSSGEFEYIRVQQAGFAFTATNELNGIAMQGVGSGTLFRNIQIHKAEDDGIEWFGGTVNARNIVVTGAKDDSLDWTDGWVGALQFALVVQNAQNDNGIEADNNGDTPSRDVTPRSAARLSNITLIGEGDTGSGNEGIQVRAGVSGSIVNTIVTNFGEGLEFNPAGTGPNPVINGVMIAGNTASFGGSGATLFNAGANNRQFANNTLNGVFPGALEQSVPVVTPTSVDPSFTNVSYIGAFSSTDTAATAWTAGWTINIPAASATACPTGTTVANETPASAGFTGRSEPRTCVVNSPVTGTVRLIAGNLYRLDGSVFVGVDRGADLSVGTAGTLTIDAGVTVYGNQTTGVVDLLTVSRGSQIFVNGTNSAPVVLTSRADLVNGGAYRVGASAEWGGLAVNGRAPLNECTVDNTATPGTAACQQNGEGGSGRFGGATADDNSGRINYMQIRYAGFAFTPTNELNSIAFQGTGSGTQVRYVQIVNGEDDGIEWFGGSVNVKNLIVTSANDDSIDWTDGWVGTLQYAVVRQKTGNDNGIEADNNGDAGADLLPRSKPIVSNLTLIGDGSSGEGVQVRAGTYGAVLNTVVTNFSEGLEFNRSGTGPDPIVQGLRLAANTSNFTDQGSAIFTTGGSTNATFATSTLTAPTGATTAVVPGANEAAAGVNPRTVCATVFGVAATAQPCAQLDEVTYVGAVRDASDRWWEGWTTNF